MKQEKKSFDLIIKIKSKQHQRSKLLFDNYINNNFRENTSALEDLELDFLLIQDTNNKTHMKCLDKA